MLAFERRGLYHFDPVVVQVLLQQDHGSVSIVTPIMMDHPTPIMMDPFSTTTGVIVIIIVIIVAAQANRTFWAVHVVKMELPSQETVDSVLACQRGELLMSVGRLH